MAEYRGERMRAVVEAVELSPVAAKDVRPLTGNEAIVSSKPCGRMHRAGSLI